MTAHITLEYQGQRVTATFTGPSRDGIEFLWEDGNWACDCNRSIVAREAGADWPELECSNDKIEVVAMTFDGPPEE